MYTILLEKAEAASFVGSTNCIVLTNAHHINCFIQNPTRMSNELVGMCLGENAAQNSSSNNRLIVELHQMADAVMQLRGEDKTVKLMQKKDIWNTASGILTAYKGRSWVMSQLKNPSSFRPLNRSHDLVAAAISGLDSTVKRLLETGAEANACHDHFGSALHAAAFRDDSTTAELLLHNGARGKTEESSYSTVLQVAVSRNARKVIRVFLEGQTCDERTRLELLSEEERGDYGSPLGAAAAKGHEDIARLLLSNCVNVDSKDKLGRTPLFWAATNGREPVVRLLMEQKHRGIAANPNSTNKFGWTPLAVAIWKCHEPVVRLLVRPREITAEWCNGISPLMWAAEAGHINIVQLLLDRRNLNADDDDVAGGTALLFAAERGHTEVVRLLLSRPEVDINRVSFGGSHPLLAAFLGKHKGVIHLLLERMDLRCSDCLKERLLTRAAREDDVLTLRLLFEIHGADPNSKRSDGMTPLLIAAAEGHESAVRQLLKQKDIDLNAKNSHEMTPLMCASMSNDVGIVRLLLGHDKVNLNLREENGCTALLMAVENGHERIVRLLLDHDRIDPNLPNNYGVTPMYAAAMTGRKAIVQLLLARRDLTINLKHQDRASPLFVATSQGNYAILRLLVKHAAIHARSKDAVRRTKGKREVTKNTKPKQTKPGQGKGKSSRH